MQVTQGIGCSVKESLTFTDKEKFVFGKSLQQIRSFFCIIRFRQARSESLFALDCHCSANVRPNGKICAKAFPRGTSFQRFLADGFWIAALRCTSSGSFKLLRFALGARTIRWNKLCSRKAVMIAIPYATFPYGPWHCPENALKNAAKLPERSHRSSAMSEAACGGCIVLL